MRTLLTPRWLMIFVIALLACAAMVLLGRWQYSRYEMRNEINARIDASTVVSPVPVDEVLPHPTGLAAGEAANAPTDQAAWTRVEMTGRYDTSQEILVRNRTAAGRVGYEVITPLVFADGTAILIDRGWIPPHPQGMTAPPDVPPAPVGEITVVGRVHLTESGADAAQQRNGRWETRRVGVPQLATNLPYPVYGAYVLADAGSAGATAVVIEVSHENDWLNLGYAVQWWIFAAGALVAAGWLARREIRSTRRPDDSAVESGASTHGAALA